MRKKIIVLLTAICMICTMVPSLAFAEDGQSTAPVVGEAPATGGDTANEDPNSKEQHEEIAEPTAPKVSVLKKNATQVTLSWDATENTTNYEVYSSTSKSEKYTMVGEMKATKKTYTHKEIDLTPNKTYYFYVLAKNVTETESKEAKSNVVKAKTPKATTKVSGSISKHSIKARKTMKDTVSISAPFARTLQIQMVNKGKWKTVKKIKLKAGIEKQKLVIKYPNSWWKLDTTTWRYVINANSRATKYTSKKIKLKTRKFYQNPKRYLQLTNTISKHGHNYYTAPVLTDNTSTRKQHVEAMIRTAKKYLGDPYVVCRSRAPGRGVDCSGLVMQACYGAGADLWPSNPYRHRFPKYEYESRRIAVNPKLKTVSWKHRKRGDLVFYSKGGIVIHVGIYLGNGRIIHSWPGYVRISSATNPTWGYISKLKRVFI